jgi:F-type H+-transporting ATPase subunit gamma
VRPIKTLLTKNTQIVSLGSKGFNAFGDNKVYNTWFVAKDLGKDPMSFKEASLLADRILSTDRKKIYIFFNRFINVLTSRPTIKYIPSRLEIETKDLDDYEFEEPAKETRRHLADFYFACSVFHGCVENACSEIGARMTSMETASNNAKDIVNALTIEYNSRRQAAINKELSELVGGSETARDA